jgi:hypothetical protein
MAGSRFQQRMSKRWSIGKKTPAKVRKASSIAQHRLITVQRRQKLKVSIKWVEIDGVIYVMDIEDDSYHALEPEFSKSWRLLAYGDLDAQTPTEINLLEHVTSMRWLEDDQLPKSSATLPKIGVHRGLPMVVAAWIFLFQMARHLKLSGFHNTYCAVMTLPLRKPPLNQPLDPAISAFLRAERLYLSSLGANDCLPRSLALYAYLVTYIGHRATHHIGIERYPFGAHAWVCANGAPVFDAPSRIATLSEISSLSPKDL